MMRERNRQSPKPGEALAHRPFQALKSLIEVAESKPAPAPPASAGKARDSAPAAPRVEDDDTDLFLRELDDVTPLSHRDRGRVAAPPPARVAREMISDEAEALASLADLVTGKAPFDISDTDEYLEGMVQGLDPRVVRRLRRGEFAHQSHLDLHRMTAEQARPEVDRFLAEAYRRGQRCVLIIHGRGLNSKDQIPVLKNRLTSWLARGSCARLVLAFTSARLCDGGAGALYVLLRRERASKKKIEVLNGAKRE